MNRDSKTTNGIFELLPAFIHEDRIDDVIVRYIERYKASVRHVKYIIDRGNKLAGKMYHRYGEHLSRRKIFSYIMQTYYPKGIHIRSSLHEFVERVYEDFNLVVTQKVAEQVIWHICVRCDKGTFIDRSNVYDFIWEVEGERVE
ncbi:hypothetical protein FACS1894184_20710 [Clostridia bacterium]|nr:hypothetical protein FACS1894184_20710 [Clostridia bacterium]